MGLVEDGDNVVAEAVRVCLQKVTCVVDHVGHKVTNAKVAAQLLLLFLTSVLNLGQIGGHLKVSRTAVVLRLDFLHQRFGAAAAAAAALPTLSVQQAEEAGSLK